MDPSGTFLQYDAKAIGSGSEGAQQSLQEVYHKVRFTTKLRSERKRTFLFKRATVAEVKRSSASVCLSVCPHDRTKTAETTITKLATG